MYAESGHCYEGEWKDDQKHGKGKYTCKEFSYDGEWVDGYMCGKGTYTYENGDKYVGGGGSTIRSMERASTLL